MPKTNTGPFPYLAGELLPQASAEGLGALFRVLANENRLRILHAIHLAGEITPSEIADRLGSSQQAVSNQLQRLADQRVVHARRDGQHVRYRIIDPCVPGLMDLGVCLLRERDEG